MARGLSQIDLADQKVSIFLVCQLIGVLMPSGYDLSRSLKVRCPFGAVYHKDGGTDPSFRVYPDSNSAFCFRCGVYWTPSRLAAMAWDCTPARAAAQLLLTAGHKVATLREVWQQAAVATGPPKTAQLAEALKIFCERQSPDWSKRQYEFQVAGTLARCLELLELVITDQDAANWLVATKTAMLQVLGLRASSG